MGRAPCCEEVGVKKGPWTPEEDKVLVDYIQKHGHGSWRRLPKLAGLNRCGKSCRLRWTNYLRPDIKRGRFSDDEEKLIIHLHSMLGNKWSSIATKLPGRTDNEIKNYWNTHLRKKLLSMGIDPVTHRPRTDLPNLLAAAGLPGLLAAANLASGGGALGAHWDINNALKLQADAANLAKIQLLQGIFRALAATAATAAAPPPSADLVSLLSANINGAGQLPGVDHRGQYDGLVNLPVLTSAAPAAPGLSFAGFLDSFGGGSGGGAQAVAGDGLSSTELGHGGASCSNLTATVPAVPAVPAPAPALVAVGSPEDCNAGGSGGGASCEETPASSPFDGLESLNLDELNTDGGWKDLLEQMSWLNSP